MARDERNGFSATDVDNVVEEDGLDGALVGATEGLGGGRESFVDCCKPDVSKGGNAGQNQGLGAYQAQRW